MRPKRIRPVESNAVMSVLFAGFGSSYRPDQHMEQGRRFNKRLSGGRAHGIEA
jgi:hypothetical protein